RVQPQSQTELLRVVALVVSPDPAPLLFARRSARTSGMRVIPACPPRFPFRHGFNVPARVRSGWTCRRFKLTHYPLWRARGSRLLTACATSALGGSARKRRTSESPDELKRGAGHGPPLPGAS